MSGWTKGPWRFVIEGTLSANWPHIYGGDEEVAQVSANVWTKPDGKHKDYPEKEIALANARLIAKAPEMAELLLDILDWDVRNEEREVGLIRELSDKIEKLLSEIDGNPTGDAQVKQKR